MGVFRKRRKYQPEVITLPGGLHVTLERPWSEYTIAELAVLGITPGMGIDPGSSPVASIVASGPRKRGPMRRAVWHRRTTRKGKP